MKLTKRQINQFNKPDTHLVISRWPSRLPGAVFDGIATYTEDTVREFAKKFGARFVILAEKQRGEPEVLLIDERVLVLRIFGERRKTLFPRILEGLGWFPEIKEVYVHSEFCASGGPEVRFLAIPFLWLIKLAGRQITYYAHNVVRDFEGIGGHFNLRPGSWKLALYEWGLGWYFRGLAGVVDRFVVLEEEMKERLAMFADRRKIVVQPHWVKLRRSRLSKVEAKRRLGVALGKKVVLSFGFVTYYKGADWLVNFAQSIRQASLLEDVEVVLAGGRAYSLDQQNYYRRYYERLKSKAMEMDNLRVTGFVSEEEKDLWFAAADVVLLPYRGLMGGSGSLQQALQRDKIVLMSTRMYKGYRKGRLGNVMREKGLAAEEVVFHLDWRCLARLLAKMEDPVFVGKLEGYVKALGKAFSSRRLVREHYEEVYDDCNYKLSVGQVVGKVGGLLRVGNYKLAGLLAR